MTACRRSALLVLATGALVTAALHVAPVAVAAPPTADLEHPPAGDRYLRVAGTPLVAVGDDPDDVGVERIDVALLEPEGHDPACDATYDPAATSRTYEPGTDPARLRLAVAFPCNLPYELSITVTTEPGPGVLDGPETTSVTVPFGVAIPPAPVADLTAAYDAEAKVIAMDWTANDEVDLAGYLIERSDGGAAYQVVAETGPEAVSYDDDDLRAGRSYAYRVYAVRAGPDDEIPVVASSASSASARTPAPASGPAPEPPPTTAAPASDDDGPNLSGFSRRVRSTPSTVRRGRVAPTTATTRDTGFSDTLPFDPNRRPSTRDDIADGVDDGAVVADLDDDETDRRALLEPLAAGLALGVGAFHLRYLLRRASDLDGAVAAVPSGPDE